MASSRLRKLGLIALGGSGAVAAAYGLTQIVDANKSVVLADAPQRKRPTLPLLSRADQLKALQETPEYDVLIIGGGATGAGVALDSATRGFKTALVELDDFSSGTSSRSTKLIHGGVRYLQKAIMNFDREQYKMVKEALHERANLLEIAPHLSAPLPIMLPVYRWWQVPYYWVGIKAYDFVAGSKQVKSSYFLSKSRALELFPMLKKDNLCGALVYYDGQHNDARMNLSIVLTAARHGANIANHTAVTDLLKSKDENGLERISGAKVKDMITGKEFEIRAKCVVNATGPFTDTIRQMDDAETPKICQPSAGVHIILPDYYSPSNMGLLDPATSDGRVIFFLPWEKATIAGTTDRPCEVTHSPCPTESDIQFILSEVRHYLSPDIEVRRGDVLSAWSGIRPLVLDPKKKDTQSIARNHIINVSDKGLVTVAGGKWTTYRIMAKETIDAAIETCPRLKPEKDCQTDGLFLEGAHLWSPIMFIRLVQDYGLEMEVAQHLANTYGDRAFTVAKLASITGKRWPVLGKRLHEEFPYLEAEVRYAVREYAATAVDIIARRMRLAFLNAAAAEEALPRIIEIMAEELKWSKSEQKTQYEKAIEFLHKEMGQQMSSENWEDLPLSFTAEEINTYTKQFNSLDREHKGYISINDLRRSMKNSGEKLTEQQLHDILNEVDLDKNGVVELAEYLQLMNAIKKGAVSSSRLARAAEMEYSKITVDRSGGGL